MAAPAGTGRKRIPQWQALLGRSEKGGRDYTPQVEGEIPAGLNGSLYRNGPGLFERGGLRVPHLLDGDGLVQRLSIRNGQARYQNAFVQTPKFLEEEAAGTYLYATWSKRAPGGIFANLGGRNGSSQAGVTIYPVGDKLYALDEVSPLFELDPRTLETIGPVNVGKEGVEFAVKAHTKFDSVTGDWLLAGVTYGATLKLHAIVRAPDGTLKAHHVIDCPRQVYLHDFLATENYFVFLLHPFYFRPLMFIAGLRSFMESLDWRPEDGNIVLVVSRRTGETRQFEASGAFMWHGLNAYERGDEIVADFVGYDAPDHFVPNDALFYRVMNGEMGNTQEKGKLRRYVIELSRGHLREEILDAGRHEFPMIDPRVATRAHRVGYLSALGDAVLGTGLKRIEVETGVQQVFDFGARTVVGEPVFAPNPNAGIDEGWLIAQCLDGESEKSFFAIFDAQRVENGPLAKVWLDHHLPISFHGAWKAA